MADATCLSGAASNLQPWQIVTYEDVKDIPNYPEKLLIDVREPGELAAEGKIPFSVNIPLKTLEESLKLGPEVFHNKFGHEKPTAETEMIFHCKGGGRGGRATELAFSLGFVNSKSYKGSWLDWSSHEGSARK